MFKHSVRTTVLITVTLLLLAESVFASDALRYKRDLRSCLDKAIPSASDDSVVYERCASELQRFFDEIDDSLRRDAMQAAVSGYVRSKLGNEQKVADNS